MPKEGYYTQRRGNTDDRFARSPRFQFFGGFKFKRSPGRPGNNSARQERHEIVFRADDGHAPSQLLRQADRSFTNKQGRSYLTYRVR